MEYCVIEFMEDSHNILVINGEDRIYYKNSDVVEAIERLGLDPVEAITSRFVGRVPLENFMLMECTPYLSKIKDDPRVVRVDWPNGDKKYLEYKKVYNRIKKATQSI